MKEHGISVIYVNCQGYLGGGLHCLTIEERENWDLGVPQNIPIRSDCLPTCIPTQFILVRSLADQKKEILFITRDPVTGIMTEHPVNFVDGQHSCVLNLLVPLEGRLDYTLKVDGKLLDDQECYVLPGHPQVVRVAPIVMQPCQDWY
jgi:hypothetical protein